MTNLPTSSVGEQILLRARTHLRLEALRWPQDSVQCKELQDGAEFLYDFLLGMARGKKRAQAMASC